MQTRKAQLGTHIPVTLLNALRRFSRASGIPMTRIVEDAIRAYLAKP